MRLALTTVTRNRKGQTVRVTRIVEGETFALGRGAQCTIHLPDPRVALEHATIYVSEGGVRLGVVGPATMLVNGRSDPEVRLAPGVTAEIGPYVVAVEAPPAGADLELAIELVRPLPDDLVEIKKRSRISLNATGLSMRRPAWVLAGVILLLFLAIPVVNALMPALRAATAKLSVTPDASWSPGPLTAGHTGFGGNCAACHETPFLRVRDNTCLKCHGNIPGHVMPVSVQADMFGGTRCASCHADHKGTDGMVRRDAGLCEACHQDLKRRLPGTQLADVGDFAAGHPEFRISLWAGPGSEDFARVAQSDKPRLVEQSHLKYPHDEHLKANIRGGPRGRVTLQCSSCHVPDASGRSFLPIDMNQHCLECHTLQFEPAVTPRQVPHGNVDDVMATMQEFYANLALKDVAVDVADTGAIRRGIPGGGSATITDDQRRRALKWSETKGAIVAQDLFEKRVCVVCHEIIRTQGTAQNPTAILWNVMPLHLPTTFMPKARFDHDKHTTYKCTDCHEGIAKSKSSRDVLLPDIASCRICHAGSKPVTNKVVSTCVSCHGFHETGHPPWNQRAALDDRFAQASSPTQRRPTGSAP
jgi:pSer/pThr/pTyr-binding forkhead associated (FHA) protein